MPQLFSALRVLGRHTVMKSALEMLVEGGAHSIGSEWVFPSPGGWALSGFDFNDLLRELAFEFLVPAGTATSS